MLRSIPDHRRFLVRYLLGSLPEHEQNAIEQQYLRDERLFDELLMLENELADGYVRGLLSDSDRTLLEKHWLNDARRVRKVALAADLRRYIEREMFRAS